MTLVSSARRRPAMCSATLRPSHRMEVRPHDLLAASCDAMLFDHEPPAWAHESLGRWPIVVVRRAEARGARVPVGVRGASRAERIAGWLPATAIIARLSPEQLVARRAWLETPRASALPHFRMLEMLCSILQRFGLAWGPTGGMGYELASGRPCLEATSDIDILVRAPAPIARADARDLDAALASLPVRVDAQLDIGPGACALAELARSSGRVLLRTDSGPRLVRDPWAAREGAD